MLLCAVLIVVFNHRACFCPGSRYVYARLCVSALTAFQFLYKALAIDTIDGRGLSN